MFVGSRMMGKDMDSLTFREAITDAIRYWEPRCLLYNGLLAEIVLFYLFSFSRTDPSLKAALSGG